MLTAIALDDEIPALEIIQTFAEQSGRVRLEACFNKTREALQFLENHTIDLLFLDIQMPRMSGIEFLKNIHSDQLVVFTTSYSEYAVESYNLNAVDYLLKPFTYNRFLQAIDKVETLRKASLNPQPLVFKANYGLVSIFPTAILFIEGLDNYIKIHQTGKSPLVVRMPMKSVLEQLPPAAFVRVHRSYIVAIEKIQFVRNKIIHINGWEIPLGGTYEEDFFQIFQSS